MIRRTLPFVAAGLLGATPAFATVVKGFTESRSTSRSSASSAPTDPYAKLLAARSKPDVDPLVAGGLRANFRKFMDRVRIPGFISASELPTIAQVAGPVTNASSFRLGDTVYLRWMGTPGPREGDRYQTFSPAIVMQNLIDATDFQVRARPADLRDVPKDYRMAGFFYEATSTLRIVRVRQGIAEAVIERLSGVLDVGSQLMPDIPVLQKIPAVTGGIQLAAAVVSGSPADRLSTTTRSFIYINRGARDGIKVGRVFQAIETVNLDGPVNGPAPERSLGEAVVVYVTDSYSTAMITKQFEVIRIGSLLKTRQELDKIPDASPFRDLVTPEKSTATSPGGLPEIPEASEVGSQQDKTLPEPGRAAKPELSELDALEKSMKTNALSPEERARLGRLSRQEQLDAEDKGGEDAGAPEITAPQKSFGTPKADPKKKPKKSKKSHDEEELNLLLQDN